MEKKILIICNSFFPDQSPRSFRATELAKEFSRQGHDVTVLTYPNEKHEKFAEDTGVNFEYLADRKLKVPVFDGGKIKTLLSRVLKRSLDLFFNYPKIQHYFTVKNKIKNKNQKYDALISIAVPHPIHWGVASVWEKEKSQNIAEVWIADCGDPFMYSMHDTFNKLFYFHYFENKFLRLADYVTVPFEEMKNLFNDKFVEKFKVISQGFKFGDRDLPDYSPNDVPTFVYSGTIMPGYRDLFSLIDFLLENNQEFKFIIYTKQQHLFSDYDDIINKNIFLKDYIPRDELIKELAKADFLVNVNTDSVNGEINAVPTKLIDYKISGRPILSYEQSKLPESTVREFMNGNYENAYNDFDLDRYRIENVVDEFLKLIDR